MVLEKIEKPNDIKKLEEAELPVLAEELRQRVEEFLSRYKAMSPEEILGERYQRFRNI